MGKDLRVGANSKKGLKPIKVGTKVTSGLIADFKSVLILMGTSIMLGISLYQTCQTRESTQCST